MENIVFYEPITDYSTLKLSDYVVVEDLSEPSNFSLKKFVNNIKTIKVTDLIGPAAGLKILGKSTGSSEITNTAKAINVTTGVVGAAAVAGVVLGPAAAAGLAGTAAKYVIPTKPTNPGAQFDVPVPPVDNTSQILTQQLLNQQINDVTAANAAQAETEKQEQMKNFIALGVAGLLVIVLVVTLMKK